VDPDPDPDSSHGANEIYGIANIPCSSGYTVTFNATSTPYFQIINPDGSNGVTRHGSDYILVYDSTANYGSGNFVQVSANLQAASAPYGGITNAPVFRMTSSHQTWTLCAVFP
jgi:hypothetical protein